MDFILRVDGHGHNNFRGAKVLLRSRRGLQQKTRGGYPFDKVIETHEHAGEFKEW